MSDSLSCMLGIVLLCIFIFYKKSCRYNLLVKKKHDITGNYTFSKKKVLFAVWALFLPLLFLSNLTIQIIMRLYGWPSIEFQNLDQSATILISVSGVAIGNVPDVVSICIYFKIWKHFQTSVGNAVDEFANDDLNNYGGIWVGEANEPIPHALEGDNEDAYSEYPNPQDNAMDGSHEAKAVMRALRYHICLSLLDMVLLVRIFFAWSLTKLMVVFFVQAIVAYWIPLFVIVNGFQQLHKIRKGSFTASLKISS